MIDKSNIGKIGYDRILLEVDIKAIDTSKMNGEQYAIGYAAADDTLSYEILDKADNTLKKIKTMKVMYKIDGGAVDLKEKDSIKYGVEVKQRRNNLNGNHYTTVLLDIVMGRVAYGTTHNVYNVNTKETAEETINRVAKELAYNGIELTDPTEWRIVSAEGNRTVETEYELKYYEKIMEWAFNKLYESGEFKEDKRVRSRNKDGSTSMTYSCKSKRREMKIYDKTAHIKDTLNIYIEDNLIRCEVKWNREGIERAFGSNEVEAVLYDMEALTEAYNRTIDDVCKTLKAAAEKEIKQLYKQIHTASVKCLKEVYKDNEIFDVVFLILAAEKKYKEEGKRSVFSRDTKRLLTVVGDHNRFKYKDLIYILTAFRSEAKLITFSKATDKYNFQ